MFSFARFCIVAVLLLSVTGQVQAGVLYARRPGTENPVYNLQITKIRTAVRIVGQMAVTHVDEEFFNDNHLTLEGFYAFRLPDGAKVNGLWLWVNGKRLRFIVKPVEEAQRMYDSVVVGLRRDPAILQSLGNNRFQLKIFPIAPNSSRRIELRYFQTLPMTPDGYVHYSYPLNMQGYQSTPVQVTELGIEVETKLRIEDLETSFDSQPLLNRVVKHSDYHYSMNFGLENQNYTQDYLVKFRTELTFDLFPALSWTDPALPGSDPYFMCWHPVREKSSDIERDIVFVLDASGSMSGNRISTVTSAVKTILSRLSPQDHFRIVLFGSNALAEPGDRTLLAATPENIAVAQLFIDQYYTASGGTNYEAAFIAALDAEFRPDAEKRMVFLTDGEPTIGEKTLDGLMTTIEEHDKYFIQIFPVIFFSSHIELLFHIAARRGGKVTEMEAGDDLTTIIARILLDLDVAGIVNASVTYERGKTRFVYPEEFPPIVSLDQLLTTGRITGDNVETATLKYIVSRRSLVVLSREVDFKAWATDLREVASYWAAERIDDLLDEIKTYGELPELKQSIVDLSIRHQVLSPYTAFLVLETNVIDPPTSVATGVTVPEHVALHQNYPNPFSASASGSTTIKYDVAEQSQVRIVITDLLGRVVRVLLDRRHGAGSFTISWDALNAAGRPMPPGIYFVRLSAGKIVKTMKMVIMR